MKIKKTLLGAIALSLGVMLFACNPKKVDYNEPDPDPNPSQTAFLSFKMAVQPVTRAIADPNASANEVSVSSAYLLLFDKTAGKTLQYKKQLAVSNQGGTGSFSGAGISTSNTSSEEAFVAKALQVKKTDYSMVVLLNPSASLLSYYTSQEEVEVAGSGTATTFDEFNASRSFSVLTSIATNVSGNDYKDILMSNSKGVVDIPQSSLKGSASEAEQQVSLPVVNVSRAMAKIKVVKDDDFSATLADGSKVESVTWKMDITNTKMFILRNFDPLTETSSSPSDWYAIDPNMIMASKAPAVLGAHFNSINKPFDNGSAFNTAADSPSYEYVLENTMDIAEQTPENIGYIGTRVMMSVQITPDGYAKGDGYYTFKVGSKKVLFNHAQAVAWKAADDFPQDLSGVQDVIDETGLQIDFTVGEEPPVYMSKGGLTYHKSGMNVYYIPIRHFKSESLGITDLGYYGVVRNNVYEVTVKSLKGPGEILTDDKNVSASIRMLPWEMRCQDAEDVEGE